MHRKFILLILIPGALLFGQERKGFWVVRYALETPEAIDKIIHTAYVTGINELFIQVRALGEVYFRSSIEGKTPGLGEAFDPLAYAIDRAALYDIKIHAWVNMFYIWSGKAPPADSMHVFHRLNRAVLRKAGIPDYRELQSAGIEGFFLDPQDEQVKNYLLNLLGEIADNYDVAGIHLDYFRYPDINYSFTPASRSNFMLRHWFDPLDIYQAPEGYAGTHGFAVYREADRQYREYISAALTDYLHRIRDMLGQRPRKIELSVAVKPDPVKAKHRYFQNWRKWIDEGACDFVVVMNYNKDKAEFNRVLKQFSDQTAKQNILMGIATYNQRIEAVLERIDLVRAERFAGFSLFSYNHLIENQGYLSKLKLKSKL